MKLILFLFLLDLLYVGLNLFRLSATCHYYRKFKAKAPNLSEYVPAVERLFDKAGTNQVFASTMYAGKSITFCLGMNKFRAELDEIFMQTIGTYKFRIRNAFNPIYWLELPDRIVIRQKRVSRAGQRIFSLLFWTASIVTAYLINRALDVLFPDLPLILESILR